MTLHTRSDGSGTSISRSFPRDTESHERLFDIRFHILIVHVRSLLWIMTFVYPEALHVRVSLVVIRSGLLGDYPRRECILDTPTNTFRRSSAEEAYK